MVFTASIVVVHIQSTQCVISRSPPDDAILCAGVGVDSLGPEMDPCRPPFLGHSLQEHCNNGTLELDAFEVGPTYSYIVHEVDQTAPKMPASTSDLRVHVQGSVDYVER